MSARASPCMHPHIPSLGHLVGQLIILLVVASNQNLIQQPCVIARQQNQQIQPHIMSALLPQSSAMLDHCMYQLCETVMHLLQQEPRVVGGGGTREGYAHAVLQADQQKQSQLTEVSASHILSTIWYCFPADGVGIVGKG